MATHSKRARPDAEASQSQPQSFSKRQKQQLQEVADETTTQDDVRYMRTQPKIQQPSGSSRAKSFPSQMSQLIDLTPSDEVEEVFPTSSSRSKARQDQAEEQRHSKYALRSKTPRNPQRDLLIRPWDNQSVQEDVLDLNEGEQRWTLPPKPPVSTDEHARCQQNNGWSWNKDQKQTRKERKMAKLAATTAIIFTIPEAMAALARPQLAMIAYDLPTGAYLSYPVKRSYHLGAMGRYRTRAAMHASLPYRPSGAAKGSSRFNNPRSDYTEANARFT
ncbi:hypothetical protein G6011_09169 [Alternaria panax]|uniref:Uncharacterized protein n=1 Tax=Alternaria panax TaxID=48097 RepID=A0AAD4IAJ0_9PLEO|nr:hypothetical protein G6011_09169 [Alternaria panax]